MSSVPLSPAAFFEAVRDTGIAFYCGVPDSLLKDFCAFITQNVPAKSHVITANEGNAVALATGYHLATGKTAMVYLQNSGLGNAVNPLVSLASPAVSSIPILLLIGWRGEPGVKDEPQHVTQGKITPELLEVMNIPSRILPQDNEKMREVLREAKHHFEEKKSAFALLVKSKTFGTCKLPPNPPQFSMTREQAVTLVLQGLSSQDVVVSTTGMLSREVYEYRALKKMSHEQEFLTVGAMGHSSMIALGIALQKPNRQVFSLDGDGAVLMHMGALATIAQRKVPNFRHIVFNNGAHDSVGGQPTEARHFDDFSIPGIAMACGYKEAFTVKTETELVEGLHRLQNQSGPTMMEVLINTGNRTDLGRPTRTTHENKEDFMEFLKS
ncbi:hypothetical protein C0Q70_05218 [Pomacea canaliculata]|uniref:2-hydroxyacyl-CoA lyase 2 n=3 Tax=Pomacea canaliculata TaxID=400727 RepID=A0A2T7PKJ3_POMCA|nr:hypothetical protein C0Q70_05218 [Pomacea canaliculata]